jgi:multiple sugar transport system substrate-binding protein
MVSRDDMAWLQEEELTQPVDALLDERGVDFGDNYSRDGLQAFSSDDRLQCMPYGISPMVIFYNTKLVDFDRMEARGLSVPGERLAWSFDQFVAAAEFATRPRRGTRGVYVEPTLEALAPFVYSGAGPLFDDEADPTSLAFSDDTTRDALERTLELLRSPTLTLSEQQLAKRSPLAWFKRGKLGMIEGYREMVPELRQVQGLEFDVIAMPSLEQSATIGQVTGLCLSDRAADTQAAADFMVHVLGTPSVERVARSGYLVPANLEVALSDAFLQPGRLPEHAPVFNNSVRSIVFLPLLSTWPQLENAIAPALDRLLNQPILDNLEELTEQIDEASRTVLDPEAASESASPDEQE